MHLMPCIRPCFIPLSMLHHSTVLPVPPLIKPTTPSVRALEGRDVVLSCHVIGNATHSWTRVGVIPGSREPALPSGAVAKSTPTENGADMMLYFGDVDAKDAGNYACIGANPAGVVEGRVELTVVGKRLDFESIFGTLI